MEEFLEAMMLDVPMLPNSTKTNRSASVGPSHDKMSEDRASAESSDFESNYAQDASEPRAGASSGDASDQRTADENAARQKTDPEKSDGDEARLQAADDATKVEMLLDADQTPDDATGVEASEAQDIPKRKAVLEPSEIAFQQWLLQASSKDAAGKDLSVAMPGSSVSAVTAGRVSASETELAALRNGAAGDTDASAMTVSKSDVVTTATATTMARPSEPAAAGSTNIPAIALAQMHPAAHPPSDPQARKLVADRAEERLLNRFSSTETAMESPKSIDPKPAPVQQTSASLPPQGALTALSASDPSSSDLKPLIDGPIETATTWEAKTQAPASLSQVIARAETPAMIGRQIAEAFHRMSDKPMELALNPQELGRVKLSISTNELGITVSVLAERPETLDLMRRNIDQLAREFQMIGYESINFAFSEGRSDQSPEHSDKADDPGYRPGFGEDRSEQPVAPKAINLSPTTGLDLRL